MELFRHQETTIRFLCRSPGALVTSDPGTGKTISVLEAWRRLPDGGRMLIIAPLSILEPSWAADARKWIPGEPVSIAYAKNREKAFAEGNRIVVTNHDAVKWIADNPKVLEGFNTFCIDEFTAFKHRTSQRSKAMRKIMEHFHYRWLLSGTPNSNDVTDLWFPAFLVDGGARLGPSFSLFRNQVCTPIPVPGVPNAATWVPKPGAEEIVADKLRDITIRFAAEDCLDLPAHRQWTIEVQLPAKLRKLYKELQEESCLAFSDRMVNAVHAGARAQKLLQLCSGAVYDEQGNSLVVGDERYELVAELCAERKHTVVAFNWHHQKEQLIKHFTQRKLTFAVIDGSTDVDARSKAVQAFQAGELRVLLAHPQSAGHGLTLTRGTTTIWASPTYNAEWFQQFNRRVYRAGQTEKTETILIAATDTIETIAYEKLSGKIDRMDTLLAILKNSRNSQETRL